MLTPVDRLEVLVLLDNTTDNFSSVPPFVETEFAAHRRRGMRLLSGKCLCCAAHGLSCLITAHRDGDAHTLLFDTGPDDVLFERNVTRLGVNLGEVDCLVLSHGHWDHAGAMLRALDLATMNNGGKTVPTYVHPGMFGTRATKGPAGMQIMEDVPSPGELAKHGGEVVNTKEPQVLLDSMFYISGEIPRLTPFEEGMPGQYRRWSDDQDWEEDPLVMDERFVAVHVKGKGLIVFTACSHAGVVNVLMHARAVHPEVPLYGVMGGFHLSGTNERVIPQTVESLRQFNLALIAAAHCTGWRALGALASAFGEAVVPVSVGKQYHF